MAVRPAYPTSTITLANGAVRVTRGQEYADKGGALLFGADHTGPEVRIETLERSITVSADLADEIALSIQLLTRK